MSDRRARFEAIYGEHVTAVSRYCLRRSPPDIADDVAAETFLVAWRRLDELPDDVAPWLFGVARNILANHSRGERRQRAVRDRLAAERPVPPPEPGDPGAAVRAALAHLSERDREAIMLIHWEGLTPTQAARVLGTTAAAMRVRLHRAHRRLARVLGDPTAASRAEPTYEPSGGLR
jgi:RNA polymerase sigma-70 factor, ECF subfamily